MAVPVGALDGSAAPAVHLGHAGAVEGAALADHALLQGGGQDDGLEGGAGFIGAADGAIGHCLYSTSLSAAEMAVSLASSVVAPSARAF